MKADTSKPLNWYKYETAEITVLWKGITQPMGRYNTAEAAKNAIYDIAQTDQEVKEFSIHTPNGVINYEQFKN